MGKYMKKSKIRGDVAVVMEVTTKPTTVGVCTRAKTLALDSSSFSFLQLRNRRLLKPAPPPPVEPKKSQPSVEQKKNQLSKQSKVAVESVVKSESSRVDSIERSSRESTPCSLTGSSNTNRSLGSTSRQNATETDRRGESDTARSIPTPNEMEAFFLCAEQQLQRSFMEKYNYDIVHDLPLPGRYEWFEV